MDWTARDGAPGNIAAITQSSDGYLWLGTPLGLYRFDGLQFASYPITRMDAKLPSSDIDALSSDSHGGIWIGFRVSGGIRHLTRDGVLTSYNPSNQLGPKSAQKIVVGGDQSVWAIGDNRLLFLRGDRWVNFGAEHGLPDEQLWTLFLDRQGNVWTSTRQKLFVLRAGQTTFQLYPTKSFIIVDMAEMPNGQIWISDGWRAVRPLNSNSPQSSIPMRGYTRMLIEPSGTLWMAQDYRGVAHLQPVGAHITPTQMVEETDLTSEQTDSMMRDRDGNIWIGTSRGLDRFQSSALRSISNTRVEYYPALAADREKGVWVAMLAHPLVHVSGDVLFPMGPGIGSSPIASDDDNRVWLVDPIRNALIKYDRNGTTRIPVPEAVHQAPAQSIGLDYDGTILVSFDEFGLWRFNGHWEQLHDPSLPGQNPLTIFRDKDRQVWLGYPDGHILMRDQLGYHLVPLQKSGDLGNVLTFAVSHDRFWAAGANGIAYLDHGFFRRVSLRNNTILRGVSGVVEDNSGALWLNASTGIIRISASELQKLSSESAVLEYDLLDDRQGVEGTAAQIKPTPSAVAGKDGSLWFSTSGEVYSVNPAGLSIRTSKPDVLIQRVLVNGDPIMDREHISPSFSIDGAALKELEIDYIGIDLAAPEKVSYQYMLEGEDKTWRDVGDRRRAFYTHLRPGNYRFRVRASNGVTQWAEYSAPLGLTIAPAFYQTSWFYLVSIAAAAMLLYLLYLLRVQYVTSRLKERLKERTVERIRIARELHDTLLQSIHGLMLRFHVAAQKLPTEDPARQSLEVALARADSVYLETRKHVESLRDDVGEDWDLASMIAKRSVELEIHSRMAFRIIENGQRQVLDGAVLLELYRIASEAITNTLHHSNAPSAEVVLIYGPTALLLRCCDTGVGLPASVLANGQRSGHWGLIGMRERALVVDGKFQIWSSPQGGTEIEVQVPARRAYRYPHSKFAWLQRLFQFRRAATGLETVNGTET
jgi:signal transduction histidine kinase/ligand-binding sensor domain-containing protein